MKSCRGRRINNSDLEMNYECGSVNFIHDVASHQILIKYQS